MQWNRISERFSLLRRWSQTTNRGTLFEPEKIDDEHQLNGEDTSPGSKPFPVIIPLLFRDSSAVPNFFNNCQLFPEINALSRIRHADQ